jgi:two-component system cell cycle sensor histidine kinase/response regulator CckA
MVTLISNSSGKPRIVSVGYSILAVNVMTEVSQQTILVIDDDPQVRTLIVRVLTKAGYRVLEACEGAEGAALFRAHQEAISLVILDLVMPGLGGLDVANELTTSQPQLRVLYISGYAESIAAHSIRRAAPSLMIVKPFSPNTLLDRVRELVFGDIAKSA